MTNETLKPCPFCGGKALIVEIPPHTHEIATWMPDYRGEAFIECTTCACAMSADTKKEAIEAWNRRQRITITIIGGAENER